MLSLIGIQTIGVLANGLHEVKSVLFEAFKVLIGVNRLARHFPRAFLGALRALPAAALRIHGEMMRTF
jgi:hypothetical protein